MAGNRNSPRRTAAPRGWPARAVAPALVLALLLATPSAWAAFTATVPTSSSLDVRASFPDYPTSVKERWDPRATPTPSPRTYVTDNSQVGLDFYHRGEDAFLASDSSSYRTAADSRTGTARNGTYHGGTDGPALWWPVSQADATHGPDRTDPRAGGMSGTVSGTGYGWTTTYRDTPSTANYVKQSSGVVRNQTLTLTSPNTTTSLEAPGPALNPATSFTVSAWVRANGRPATNGYRAAVSQDGHTLTGFALGLVNDGTTDGAWVFAMPKSADAGNYQHGSTTWDAVQSPAATGETSTGSGTWVHLTGTFDLATMKTTLHVMPTSGTGRTVTLSGTRPSTSLRFDRPTTSAACRFAVGRAQSSGAGAGWWTGDLDEVRVFPRALGSTELDRLAREPMTHRWSFTDLTSTNVAGKNMVDDVVGHSGVLGTSLALKASSSDVGLSASSDTDQKAFNQSTTSGFAETTGNAVDTSKSFSVAAAFFEQYGSTTKAAGTLVSQNAGADSYGFALTRETGSSPNKGWTFKVRDSTGTVVSATWAWPSGYVARYDAGRWVYAVGTYDKERGRIFLHVDGSLVASAAVANALAGTPGNFQVGRTRSGGSATYVNPNQGSYDVVTTYDWAFSPGDALDSYRWREPSRFGEMALGTLGALSGADKLTAQGSSTSVAFSGTSGAYNDGTSATTGAALGAAFSVEFWFSAGQGASGGLAGFASGYTLGTSGYDRATRFTAAVGPNVYLDDGGRVAFGVVSGGSIAYLRSDSGTPSDARDYRDGRWHHVAATFGANGMSLYVDGTFIARNATATRDAVSGWWRWGGAPLHDWTGRYSNFSNNDGTTSGSNNHKWFELPNHHFTGLLDEVAVYTRELSAQDVAWHYHADH